MFQITTKVDRYGPHRVNIKSKITSQADLADKRQVDLQNICIKIQHFKDSVL